MQPSQHQSDPSIPTDSAGGGTTKNTSLSNLGWRILHYRVVQGLNAEELALQIGLSTDELRLLERGAFDPHFSTVCKILEVLELEWWELYRVEILPTRRVYDLDLDHQAWQAIEQGRQTFDIRPDTERYQVGGNVHLHEQIYGRRTGLVLARTIIAVVPLASVGLTPGYVALGLHASPDVPQPFTNPL